MCNPGDAAGPDGGVRTGAGPDKDTDSCGFFRGNVCVFQKKERRCRRMKMLFLNVSPRRDGGVARMLEAMADEARARGAEVVCERVSSLSVRACTGCMVCRGEGRCVLPPDDAQRVLELLRWCDVLVVGTPCYWGNIPGTLKVLFDRMVYGMMGESRRGMPRPLLEGRRAWLVVTCTTPWPFNVWFRQSRGTVRALREVLRWSGFRVAGCIERGGTRQHPVDGRDLERCRRAVRRLCG